MFHSFIVHFSFLYIILSRFCSYFLIIIIGIGIGIVNIIVFIIIIVVADAFDS